MAIIGYVCTAYPDTEMSLIFLPFVHFKAHHVSLITYNILLIKIYLKNFIII